MITTGRCLRSQNSANVVHTAADPWNCTLFLRSGKLAVAYHIVYLQSAWHPPRRAQGLDKGLWNEGNYFFIIWYFTSNLALRHLTWRPVGHLVQLYGQTDRPRSLYWSCVLHMAVICGADSCLISLQWLSYTRCYPPSDEREISLPPSTVTSRVPD
jgi:hypothetical protein